MGLRPAKFHEKLREAQGIPRCARWFFDPVWLGPPVDRRQKNRSPVPRQTIVFSGLLGWACGPRNFMKNWHHGKGGSGEVGVTVEKSRSLVCLTRSMRALRE